MAITTKMSPRRGLLPVSSSQLDLMSLMPTTTTPMLMTRMANHLYQGRTLLRKTLERMLTKMRLVPVSISKEEAVVRVRAMKVKILLVKCRIAGGTNRKILKGIFSFGSVSFSLCLLSLRKLTARKSRMQAASPTESPQHWSTLEFAIG